MYDWIIDSLNAVWRHGWSLTALGTAIFALLKQRKVKAQLRRLIPWLFADDSDIRQYVQNQQRIESKIDALLEREGIVWQSASSNGTTGKVSTRRIGFTSSSAVKSVVRGVVRSIIYLISKGWITMKEYLKKLGRTKFQALLASLIVNIASAVLFMNGTIDIDPEINRWMPVINISVTAISTWVYIFVEGGIDKAKVQGGTTDESTSDTGDHGPTIHG
jgi:hypothetical protein